MVYCLFVCQWVAQPGWCSPKLVVAREGPGGGLQSEYLRDRRGSDHDPDSESEDDKGERGEEGDDEEGYEGKERDENDEVTHNGDHGEEGKASKKHKTKGQDDKEETQHGTGKCER